MGVSRREAMAGAVWAGAGAAAAAPQGLFQHGVASGDPRADRVIVWTRVTAPAAVAAIPVIVEVAADAAFASVVARRDAVASSARDWTVKVDVTGLAPGTAYHYRFRVGDERSPVGRTKTTPAGPVERIRLAVASCANHAQGYFNVYAAIAQTPGFDAVVHLGDYLYEYGPTGYAGADTAVAGREHAPPRATVSLADYRTRHAQYKRDPAAQALHAAYPMIAIWDDHEIANNAWTHGAEAHRAADGDYAARRAAALKAYHEWMPVRAPADGAPKAHRFKTVRFGDLAALHVLETRLAARHRPFEFTDIAGRVASAEDAARFLRDDLGDPAREKLGAAQLARLEAAMGAARKAGVAWTLLANPTLMAPVRAPDVAPYLDATARAQLAAGWRGGAGFLAAADHGLPLAMDAWDGYPAERERLYGAIRRAGVEGALVLTGDTHAWWANTLADASGAPVGVELATASVTATSAFSPANLGARADDFALLVNRDNPAVRYVSGATHGYIDLTLTRDRADAVFRAVETIARPAAHTFRQAAFRVTRGNGRLSLHSRAGLGLKEWVLFRRA
ncbi:MAG: alkaline phosphatase D family protein [Hyphomonadaceae bacterium]|nr:alkaline phosphatase D family protein [Hyphomonadaceae bacterium]